MIYGAWEIWVCELIWKKEKIVARSDAISRDGDLKKESNRLRWDYGDGIDMFCAYVNYLYEFV